MQLAEVILHCMSFVHLHVHSDYSLLDGSATIAALVGTASSFGMPGLALTDHGNMFGALKFYNECKKQGINPIIGSEFYVAGATRFEKTGTEGGNKYYHLVLLAKNSVGYRNLSILSTLSFTEGFYYKPRIDWELLEKYHEGLICSTACIAGEIPQYILLGKPKEAEAIASRYMDLFGKENYYLELQNHALNEETRVNAELVKMSGRLGLKLIATNDVHYIAHSDALAHDALLCVGTNKKLSEQNRMRFSGPDYYLKSQAEMTELFREVPSAIENTLLINEMVNLTIDLPGPQLPKYDIPQSFSTEQDKEAEPEMANVKAFLDNMQDKDICKPNHDYGKIPVEQLAPIVRHSLEQRLAMPVTRYFVWASYKGLEKRYPDYDKNKQLRLDYELATIILMDFVGYFLIVSDFINWALDHDIPVGPGRGSGAGSIVAYSLRITDIDPLKYGLLFERFLNPERISMPDFDVDFCYEGRAQVINYVNEKYGTDRVGQIITFGTLKARAVIKDVARALDLSVEESNQITKLVPDDPKITIDKAMQLEPKLKELEDQPRYQELFEIARKLENKNRHTSLHAAGIVIGKTPLVDYVPLYRDSKSGSIATQYTMELLEACGLVKMDFLGLKTLTIIKNTIQLINKNGINFKENDIQDNDEKTFAMLGEGRSIGIFQFESPGMQTVLRQAKPNKIEDLIALNALYRPGPMDNIPQYVDAKRGYKAISYPYPSLEKYLKETYGVIVYQEQVMQVAREIAGYSLGKADLLRRAMGKKKKEIIDKEREPFINGAVQRGISAAKANEIFDILEPFADYGFNKSHAAAYSVLAYKTAWLKANYPAEYMSANLTNEISDSEKLAMYISEARRMGIELLAPDINSSDNNFSVKDGKIVYGLIGVKGIGDAVVEAIIKEREAKGAYKDFVDFLDRVGVKAMNKRALEILVHAGCFDNLGRGRAELAMNLERAFDYVQKKLDAGAYGQISLFDTSNEEEFPPFRYEPCPELPKKEQLKNEKALLGFYFSGHPLDSHKDLYEKCCDIDFSRLDQLNPKKDYTLIGELVEWRETMTKKGDRMASGKVDTYDGSLDVVMFSKVLESHAGQFATNSIVFFRGKINTNRDKPGFRVESVLQASDLREKNFQTIHIALNPVQEEKDLDELRDILFEGSGQCGVVFHVHNGSKISAVKAHSGISCSPAMAERIRSTSIVAELWMD
ncbi:DNA polymerase III subunit alpha [Spirochaetota bacterium]